MRFGLIGTGYRADVAHAAGIGAHPEAELVGVWAATRRRRPTAGRAGGARVLAAAEAELGGGRRASPAERAHLIP